jgi:hypothetical protein
MGSHSTYYIPSIYPSSAMSVPTKCFSHGGPPSVLWCFIQGSQFYSMGNPLHKVPSSGGNIYPHLSNPCHVTFSSQAASSVMMPLQPFMNQFGGGYHPTRTGPWCIPEPFLARNLSKSVFPRTLVSNVATSHCKSCWKHKSSHCESYWHYITNLC